MCVHHTAHISGLGPVFTVYCIALLPSEGHWPFGCITDPNLKFERAVEDTKVVTEKNSGLFTPADSLWIPPNVSELNMDACGFVDRECESI